MGGMLIVATPMVSDRVGHNQSRFHSRSARRDREDMNEIEIWKIIKRTTPNECDTTAAMKHVARPCNPVKDLC